VKGITRLTDQADAGRKSRPRQKQRGGEGAGAGSNAIAFSLLRVRGEEPSHLADMRGLRTPVWIV